MLLDGRRLGSFVHWGPHSNTCALCAALGYVAVPLGLYLGTATVGSPQILLVYFVFSLGLLSCVGAYIAGSLIRAMVGARGDRSLSFRSMFKAHRRRWEP